jgi:hypothetical protein
VFEKKSFLWLHFYFRYEAVFAKEIPETITGDAFLEKYGDHNDAVTEVDPKRSYCVKAPTRHPIYENFRVEVWHVETHFDEPLRSYHDPVNLL